MRLVCISDTHNLHRAIRLPDGEVLIHAGDATGQGLSLELERFLAWFASQPHPHKILIAGNHDWLFQRNPKMVAQLLAAYSGITYLQDSGIEIDGLKFWGSPWQPWFCDWAFNLPRMGPDLREVWNKIPLGTDVLITHGPPHGVLDQVHGGDHLGCEELKNRLVSVKPQVHIFGHIHDSYGVAQSKTTTYVNPSSCDEQYRMRNQPIVLELSSEGVMARNTEPNLRLEGLMRIQESLKENECDSIEEALYNLPPRHINGLKGMAEFRGTAAETLLQEYIERGLRADMARQIRAETKSSKRIIPLTRVEEEGL